MMRNADIQTGFNPRFRCLPPNWAGVFERSIMARPMRQPTEGGDGSGGIFLLFAMALVVGLLAGLGAQRIVQNYGRPAALRSGATPKEIVDLGYNSETDFKADHAREQAVITKLLVSPVGSQMLWENAETGNRGVIWVASQHTTPDGGVCRDLVRHTLLNNAYRNTAATTCHGVNAGYPDQIAWRAE
jgi:hypothetical protein